MRGSLPPTRGTLRELEERIELAEHAAETLERRRDVLIMELQDALDQYQFVERSLSGTVEEAEETAAAARALEGEVALRGAARARADAPILHRRTRNVMGVQLPELSLDPVRRSLSERGYGVVGTSGAIDETADAYEILLERVVRAAEVQVQVRLLVEELTRSIRRVNGLTYRALPELRSQHHEIARRLEEREREEITRRKWVKDHILEGGDSPRGRRGSTKAGGWTAFDHGSTRSDAPSGATEPEQDRAAASGQSAPRHRGRHTAEQWAANYFDAADGGDEAEEAADPEDAAEAEAARNAAQLGNAEDPGDTDEAGDWHAETDDRPANPPPSAQD